jgi:pimeloyl-ACP methyl ester carboxylesterase
VSECNVSLGNRNHDRGASSGLLGNLRGLRRARRQGGCAVGCRRDRTDDTDLPWSSFGRYGGWGGHVFHGTDAGAERTPVVFVHGNQRDACDWADHAEFFLKRSYTGDELWAISFDEGSPSHRSMASQLDHFVRNVREHTGSETVAVVAHSLGVTGARFWLHDRDRYDWVDTVVGLAGANHGTVLNSWCAASGLTNGTYKMSPFLRADYALRRDHPLNALNRDETPGDVDYYTIRGSNDPLFWRCERSPALDGAVNVELPVDHDGVRADREAIEYVFEWVSGTDPYDLRHHVGLPESDDAGT